MSSTCTITFKKLLDVILTCCRLINTSISGAWPPVAMGPDVQPVGEEQLYDKDERLQERRLESNWTDRLGAELLRGEGCDWTDSPGGEGRQGWQGQVRGVSRRGMEGEMGSRAGGAWGRTGDQPFSFTVGDPGSLWGGITCRRVDERSEKCDVSNRWTQSKHI